jgi:hypothetical protein
MLRTTRLSYGNMRFSGSCPAKTPQLIKMKFCTIDNVGEVSRCTKNGRNRLAGGGPTDRWYITSKTFLLYLALLYLFFLVIVYSPNGLTDLHARWLKLRGSPYGSAFWGSHWYKITSWGSKTPNFGTRMPNFQPNQYTLITFERWEIEEKCQRTTFTKSGSENRTVTSFLL